METVAALGLDGTREMNLPPGVLQHLEAALGADLSCVGVYDGVAAHDAARRLGATAFASGTAVVFAEGAYRPDTDEGFRLIAHEATHVLQQARGEVSGRPWQGLRVSDPGDRFEREADRCATVAVRGGRVRGLGFPRVVEHGRPSAIVQRHVSFEHRLLGDGQTNDLVGIATGGPGRSAYLQNQIALQQLWRSNPLAVSAQQVAKLCPWIRTLTLGPDNVLVTYGEIDALPDYLANPMSLDALPQSVLLPILQCIRQESFNQLTLLLTGNNPNVTFDGAATSPWKLSLVNTILETSQLDAFLFGLGVNGDDHYQGLLARNACHFAPASWYRWQANHLIARDLAARAQAAKDTGLKAQLTQQAWTFDGYADHFLQDSFAAGHLVNKTLVMQWFIEWAVNQSVLPIPDWDLIKGMTTANQPGLAGRVLYTPGYAGPSNDPQTANEYVTFADRLVASGLAVGNADPMAIYQNFLTFLTSAVTQLASANLHDYYNDHSVWVSSPATTTPYEVWGDDTLFTHTVGGNGVQETSNTSQLSQAAINEILAKGSSGITTDQIRSHFPTRAGSASNTVTDLQAWNDGQKSSCIDNFNNFLPVLKRLLVGLASPRLGTSSRDHDVSQSWYTSLPNAGFAEVHNLLTPQGSMFVGSNGRVLQLDARSGHVMQNLLLTDRVGVGDYTTRVAADAQRLYAGVHGYVYATALNDWSRALWSTGVGNTGYNPVDVLVQGGRLFAGCNGYVYEIDPARGNVTQNVRVTSLFGTGDYTTRLGSDGQNLYVGVHGYVYCLPLTSRWSGSKWEANLVGAGYNPAEVLARGGRLFAGCNGYAFEISPGDGKVLHKVQLSGSIGVGNYTTRLASDGRYLFAGVHGYVYGVSLDDWSRAAWEAGVGNTGYNPADVLAQSGGLFAGCNGYVYRLDPARGTLLRTLLLGSITGVGDYTTTLAGDGESLYAGAHGYSYKVVSLSAAGIGPVGLADATANPDGSLQLTAVDARNTLWHTIRTKDGSWPSGWGNVLSAVPNGGSIGQVRWVRAVADRSSQLQVLALNAKNTLWHTIRAANGSWPSPWGDVLAAVPNGRSIGAVQAVTAAVDQNNDLHVLALDAANTLWHTVRKADGSWPAPWENVQAVMAGNGLAGIGPIRIVTATTDTAGNLHLVVLDEAFRPWHTVRPAGGGWSSAWEDVAGRTRPTIIPLRSIGAAANPDGSLQIAAVDAAGTLWHTIRAKDGTWPTPWGNVQAVMVGGGKPRISPTPFVAVTADASSNLHVVVLDEADQPWYTVRSANGDWPYAWRSIGQPVA